MVRVNIANIVYSVLTGSPLTVNLAFILKQKEDVLAFLSVQRLFFGSEIIV